MERRVADYLPYRSSWLAMLDEGEEECSEGKNDETRSHETRSHETRSHETRSHETRSHKGEIESLDTWMIAVVDKCND
jgi:hypothetical protein